jgi:rhamnulokinase
MLGTLRDGRLTLEEAHRFPNGAQRIQGKFYWNVQAIFQELKNGLAKALRAGHPVESLSVDSWGVDYVFLRSEYPQLALPVHYRDPRTEKVFPRVCREIGEEKIYAETGIQFLSINTIYQLAAEQENNADLPAFAEKLLLIGDYLAYLFSGVARSEVSLASTTQLYNPTTRQWSAELIEALGLPRHLFPEICDSGTVLGPLAEGVAEELGVEPSSLQVIAGLAHDTAAAVAAVPMEPTTAAYLSSGTWSLMGVELPEPNISEEAREAGFTNEIGYGGSVRFLKNLIGLWILQECRRQWEAEGQQYDYAELNRLAEDAEPLRSLIHPNATRFLRPGGMVGKVRSYCRETGQPVPESPGQFTRCILESLALLYHVTLGDLRRVSGVELEELHIVGGGSQSVLLNQLTADAAGMPVVAGPVEATAAGNLMVQALAQGHVADLAEVREVIAHSFDVRVFEPRAESSLAGEGRERFAELKLLE